MNAKDRRKITQATGARVRMELEDEVGTVVGHYDDDIVYVKFAGVTIPERVWVDALALMETKP